MDRVAHSPAEVLNSRLPFAPMLLAVKEDGRAAGGGSMGKGATGRTLPLAALPLLFAAAAAPVRAIPRLDLKPYPAPGAGETRWVIQLPGVLRPSPDPALSSDPADWRVELIVGRELEVDCNRQLLQGSITSESVPGWGYTVYRVSGGERGLSTLMACPPDQPPRRAFVPLAGEPTLVRYNASLPIVIYAPKDLQVRWRLWKAETGQQNAEKR